ncbi:alcohol dehydrogenase catalytic domain-containing protein [Blastococcus sp. URHD0036]|uniref:alcohol dehydrogenase catalytic domain-containing protein n=1 Tax=Blastococcus sp. URHD0036 TaxID=1380356 RepID=UPI00068F94CC|nr:alcohol dehydrogenase catalytic domain-containing protein [Blastococcus sp. URHD0036]
MTMQTRAAVFREIGTPWAIEEITLADPRPTELLIKLEYAGLCHSDDHNITGDYPAPPPIVGGHEGAGKVVAVGEHVTRAAVGDSVFVTSTPSCGLCRFCLDGRGWLCDLNAYVMSGRRPDGTARAHDTKGDPLGTYAQLGTFSEYALVDQTQVVPFDAHAMPYDVAAVLSCGVITGWGAAVKAGQVHTGQVVVVVGTGGLGMSAVQGARNAGATVVVAVDPVPMKQQAALKLGATHAVGSVEEAQALVSELTRNVMADVAIITVSVLTGDLIGEVNTLVAKGGRTVLTAAARADADKITLPISRFLFSAKQLVGNVYGTATRGDIARLVEQVTAGHIDVASMITKEYTLDEVNDGYRDLRDGLTIRGVIRF